jgi:4-hydroxy-tetrahydrodipicolinate reductase
MKLAVAGATGRMGRAVIRLAHQAGDIQLVGGVCGAEDPISGRDLGELAGVGNLGVAADPDVAAAILGADVVIDFSIASAFMPLVAAAERAGVPLVSGTTNLSEADKAALGRASTKVPVLWAPNMSGGVQVLAELVEHAVKRLGLDYDVELVEVHHRRKVDAPSGTARRLAEAARAARPNLSYVTGREGNVGPRKPDEMAVVALRGGDVIGDHSVHLIGEHERLELTHRAMDRDVFASGALGAARVLITKPKGLYQLSDVLG